MEIFIANLDSGIQEELLSKLFEAFGPVSKAVIAKDRETGASRGFGFITMDNPIDGQSAINDLNGRVLAGKTLAVKPSIPKEERMTQNRREFTSNQSQYEERQNFFAESLEEGDLKEEDSIEVIKGTEYTKSIGDDGYVRIRFNN